MYVEFLYINEQDHHTTTRKRKIRKNKTIKARRTTTMTK
jgi:hypothetical protein